MLVFTGCGDTKEPEPEKPVPQKEEPKLSPMEQAWADAATDAGRLSWVKSQLDGVKSDEAAAKELHEFLAKEGRSDFAEMVEDARLEADPDDEWANARKGRTNMRAAMEAVNENGALLEEAPIEEWTRLKASLSEGRTWADAGEDKSGIESDIRAIEAHLETVKDPWYREMLGVVKGMEEKPMFEPYRPLKWVTNKPYVVIAQVQDEEHKQNTGVVLERHSKLFKCLVGNFREMMNECGLPSPSVEELGNPVLKGFIFGERADFEDYHERYGGSNWISGVRAYYSWGGNQFMMTYDTGAPSRAQDPDTSTAFHEATHQLVHYYRQWYYWQELKKKDPNAPKPVLTHPHLHGRSHFFGEGIAEVFGACRLISLGTGEWKLRVKLRNRIAEWGSTKARKDPDWTLKEMLQMTGKMQLDMMGKQKWPGHDKELSSLFYAQAWAFHHYLYNGEDGLWRDLYLDYIAEEMKCNSGYEVFLKCFEIGEDEEERDSFLRDMERRWRNHQEQLYMSQLDGE
jgi:hypothetical protein